jgi:8-oxo-dGTP diphosphatase
VSIPSHRLAVAVMVLDKDNKVLLVKGYRGWEFPGGYVGEGESIKEAAIREVKEESGITIQLTKFCGIDQVVVKSTCVFLFEGKPIGGKLTTSDESSEVGYFTFDEAMSKITLKVFQDRIIRCLNKREHPFINEI